MGNFLEDLIRQAHSLYPENSVFEVVDADRKAVADWMIEMYGLPDWEKLEKYFLILDQIKDFQNPPGAVQSWAEQRMRARFSGRVYRPT